MERKRVNIVPVSYTHLYQRHNVALNVGSDNFSNRISFAYDNDEGVLINTFKKNLTLRYNGKDV